MLGCSPGHGESAPRGGCHEVRARGAGEARLGGARGEVEADGERERWPRAGAAGALQAGAGRSARGRGRPEVQACGAGAVRRRVQGGAGPAAEQVRGQDRRDRSEGQGLLPADADAPRGERGREPRAHREVQGGGRGPQAAAGRGHEVQAADGCGQLQDRGFRQEGQGAHGRPQQVPDAADRPAGAGGLRREEPECAAQQGGARAAGGYPPGRGGRGRRYMVLAQRRRGGGAGQLQRG
mmetsp:Transcript_92691/g.246246  ORF Transcript_92691/g.246246 Transcript_92691/m.246246 type:complete len:238 (+) Transcript_92691:583-1296(+)